MKFEIFVRHSNDMSFRLLGVLLWSPKEVWTRDTNFVILIVFTGLKRIWRDESREQYRILENVHIGCRRRGS